MSLFNKKNKGTEIMNGATAILQAKDRITYKKITKNDPEELFNMCDSILDGRPVSVNLDEVSASDCNYILAFLSGCVYAVGGEVLQISDRFFICARGEDLEDGSLRAYVEENQ